MTSLVLLFYIYMPMCCELEFDFWFSL